MISAARKLKRRIDKDKYNSIIFEMGDERDIYLVGGYIRDAVRGVVSSDRDYIVSGNLKSFALKVRTAVGGTLVQFRKDNTVRLVVKGLTFDFSNPIGTLREDLSKRDFTINSVAWSPVNGFIDYYNGLEDIENRKIRTLSEENMIADPLRMIRAYRFAAELKGSIEEKTREIINLFHDRMKEVSSERITLEIFNLLNSEFSSKYLKMALHDKVLNDILLLPFRMLENNIGDIYKLEKGTIRDLSYKFKVLLNKIFTQNLTYKGLLCLEILLRNEDLILGERGNIRLSNKINRRIELAHKGVREFKKGSILMNKLFGIFMNSKEASVDLLIINNRLDILGKYDKFKKIWQDGYLSSEEIVRISQLAMGPRLGEVIREVKKAQFEGKIKSKAQATNFVKRLQAV